MNNKRKRKKKKKKFNFFIKKMRIKYLNGMEGMHSSMVYLTYCKNFCKCHTVPPTTAIKKSKKGIYNHS
jgi:hypothetical protein